MPERILFLTGRLAEANLRRTLEQMQPAAFDYQVHQLGIQVAGLMTADMIRRRLRDTFRADRILVPGRCRGDLAALSRDLGLPVERGPEELRDLPSFFGGRALATDLQRHDVRIFAEIVDAPQLSIAAILTRAQAHRRAGADVIDLGCLPETPFPHLAEAVAALQDAGYCVSVDSLDGSELVRGGRAGADFLLSLSEDTLDLLDAVPSTPVLIPARHGDLASLERAMLAAERQGRAYLVDPILDPLPYGLTESLARYRQLRRRHPKAEILMGIGNVTELTDADTGGVNALLMGIAAELRIGAVLTTQVSAHACNALREADIARRMMFAARENQSLPRDLGLDLLALHERHPFPYDAAEVTALAQAVRDPSYRIQVSAAGVHIYNREGLHTDTDPFALFAHLHLGGDVAHAFYLGVELARAQIAWQLGKRYTQDQPLRWRGVPTLEDAADGAGHAAPGTTLADRAAEEQDP